MDSFAIIPSPRFLDHQQQTFTRALSLLDLPNEILIEIISYIHSSLDLFAIIRTTRSFWQPFQAIGPAIIRQRFDKTAFGCQIGLCAAVTVFRLSWLRCDEHPRGCSDQTLCARRLYQSFVAQDVAALSPHEVLGFLNLMELVDKPIDFHLAQGSGNKTLRLTQYNGCISLSVYSPAAGSCPATYSVSARQVVAEARCHYFFHDLYYRTHYTRDELRRNTNRLIRKAAKQLSTSWADLHGLLDNYFSMIDERHHPLTMVHSRIARPDMGNRGNRPWRFPVAYIQLLSS